MNLIAIDPAARRYAVAVFHDDVLVACEYLRDARDLFAYMDESRAYEWVFEVPKDYERFQVAHKDLDRLRAKLASLDKIRKRRKEKLTKYLPFQWKGNVPKPIQHRRIWPLYSASEQRILRGPPKQSMSDYDHDRHDAGALGMVHLGRVRRGGARGKSSGRNRRNRTVR